MIGLEPGWSSVKAKRVLREVDVRGHPDEILLSVTQAGGVVPRSNLDYRVWNPTKDLHNYKLVEPGQFVISLRSFQGGIEYSLHRGIVSPAYTVMSLDGDCEPGFFRYLLKSSLVVSQLDVLGSGIRQGKNISYESFGEIDLGLPPAAVQAAIADFLDRETERIDRLVEKKRRLIELLEEKRTAVISHAVTKGLDPTVPMKDSGIPWLGEIPEHWRPLRLRYLARASADAIKTGPFGSQLLASEMTDGDIKVLNQRTVIERRLDIGDEYVSRKKGKELASFTAYPGDLLITSRGTIGRCMVLPDDAQPGILHPCLIRIQTEPTMMLPEYLEILIQDSGVVLPQLEYLSNATTIDVIYSGNLRRVHVPVPPTEEQARIVHRAHEVHARHNKLRMALCDQLEKLNEYRQALITAAVTGQLDITAEQQDPEEVVA